MHFLRRVFARPMLSSALLVALFGTVHARDAALAPLGAAAERGPPVPLLWKVSDADNAVYLLGSFHLLKPDDYPLSADVDAAFEDAEHLMFELSPEEMGSPQLGMLMAQAAMRADGTRLDSELPAAMAARLRAWAAANAGPLAAMGVSPELLQLFEPWFVALMVSITELTKLGLDPKLGLDAHLAERARDAGKPAAGFETGAEQVAFLDGMGPDEQLQFLEEALDDSAQGEEAMGKLHADWRAGNADAMWREMALEMRREYPKLYRRINVDRNDAWLPRIEQRLTAPGTDDTLVVVGALHLLGEDGVVEKLRARGYGVVRICSACPADTRKGARRR